MKRFLDITSKIIDKFFIFLILVVVILAARSLFGLGYFIMHDDLQMMRQLQMEKCLLDGQIPCRWVSDMGYGFGYPLFNFYPPLPYLIGEIFRVFGFSFITAVKLNFAVSILVSGIGMYLLAKEFFGKIGGFLSAVFYIWAPYRAVDIYVRGAMNEAWAMAWFPLIFLGIYKLVKSEKSGNTRWLVFLAVTYSLLLTSHNLMVLIFTPFAVLWTLILLWHGKVWKKIPYFLVAGIWALGLSAYFTLPAVIENKFTWIMSQIGGYYDFNAHFVSIAQLLLSRFWGDGPSTFTDNDGMAFPVGHFHWILSLVLAGFLVVRFVRSKGSFFERFKRDTVLLIVIYFLFIGWFSAFMTHAKSYFIWNLLPFLRYVQFPWRFLTTSSFGFSLAVGGLLVTSPVLSVKTGKLKQFLVKLGSIPFVFLIIVGVIIWNWNFFKPVRGGPLSDSEKFSGEAWRIQTAAGIYDYLPIQARIAPDSARRELAEIMEGEGEIVEVGAGSNWGKFKINIDTESAKVRINIFDFPGWKVEIDGQATGIILPDEERWGRIWIEVPNGKHLIFVHLVNTPVRTVGNFLSVVSWITLAAVIKRKVLRDTIKRWKTPGLKQNT